MGGSAIGAFSAAPGNFTSLKLNGAAAAGYVLAGDGTSFVPTVAPGYTSGSGSGSRWQKDPAGLVRQWGTTTAIGSGGRNVSLAVTFPNAALFTDTPHSSVYAIRLPQLW